MPIARMKDILKDSMNRGYGIPAFNVVSFEMIDWAIEAAAQRRSPVVIQYYPGFTDHMTPPVVRKLTHAIAKRSKVPVVLHLDHCTDYDTMRGMFNYFDSVMVDGSSLPSEENVKLTSKVVKEAHALGIFVEAELGHVGSGSKIDDIQNSDHYTSAKQAKQFVKDTKCDALAIAIGNAHGHYVASPNLDLERLDKIRDQVDIPLVLHGGSGIPPEQLTACVEHGMSKFNVFTDVNTQLATSLQSAFNSGATNYYDAIRKAKPEVMQVMLEKFAVLNPKQIKMK